VLGNFRTRSRRPDFASQPAARLPDHASSQICHFSFFGEVIAAMVNLIIPDKWQQDAVKLLREGIDVVVHAPTGAGKTYIFELLYESLKGQAVYTVPTRALANDKLAEWRARGWDVGISTGDLAENLDARVVVATLETQKGRFLRRDGPRLLVVDEYQLIADPIRGTSYEVILSLAPPETQLLLLSGSVGNPADVVEWLRRIGRSAELISHQQRPVQLDEVMLSDLPVSAPGAVRGYWPKLISRALLADLGPVLIFAPRRQMAEDLATALSSTLPLDEPLTLTQEQNALLGDRLGKLLRNRVAFHHSGLGYMVRAGIIEPLAKRGQLRVVVATMGLAAGINFSMRSVLVTGTHYQAGNFQRQVRPDELLQMFGRAGRRGLDEFGYVLVTPDIPRLHDAHPLKLRRAEPVDWPTAIGVMREAVLRDEDPFLKAKELVARLFSWKPLTVGVERFYAINAHSAGSGEVAPSVSSLPAYDPPCGLPVDGERARLVRRHDREMLTPEGIWEPQPPATTAPLGELLVRLPTGHWRPALNIAAIAQKHGFGALCKIRFGQPIRQAQGDSNQQAQDRPRQASGKFEYGREVALAAPKHESWVPAKWLRKLLRERFPVLAAVKDWQPEEFLKQVLPVVEAEMRGRLHEQWVRDGMIFGRFRFSDVPVTGYRDGRGRVLASPETRRTYPVVCQPCRLKADCEALELSVSPALAWRQLGLVDPKGVPTRRGIIFSFFNQGEGLAIAAALEEPDYAIEDLIFDLANLRVGHRFSLDETYSHGRLGAVCQTVYQRGEYPGYLELGLPIAYGPGGSEVVRDVVAHQVPRHRLVSETVRHGDIERALTEWRSLLRQIAQAPAYDWDRWLRLRETASAYVHSTRSPARDPLPQLAPAQSQRYSGRFISRLARSA
jgi:superfamily II DNA/RNA helicase